MLLHTAVAGKESHDKYVSSSEIRERAIPLYPYLE
jgi:hypothetical protein